MSIDLRADLEEKKMDASVVRRIEAIQNELEQLKREIAIDLGIEKPRPTQLEGLWAGVEFSDEEIEEAKQELFSGVSSKEE